MRVRRVDQNQKEIVEALRLVGCSVVLLHRVGDGVPDLLVGLRGRTFLMEVKGSKDAERTTGGAKDTVERQKLFRNRWRGGPVHVVRSVVEALEALRVTTIAS